MMIQRNKYTSALQTTRRNYHGVSQGYIDLKSALLKSELSFREELKSLRKQVERLREDNRNLFETLRKERYGPFRKDNVNINGSSQEREQPPRDNTTRRRPHTRLGRRRSRTVNDVAYNQSESPSTSPEIDQSRREDSEYRSPVWESVFALVDTLKIGLSNKCPNIIRRE